MFARRSFLALPPSAKFLYVLLKARHRMTRQDLLEWTYLPPRTLNYGLSRLKDLGLIREHVHGRDKRRMVYELITAPM